MEAKIEDIIRREIAKTTTAPVAVRVERTEAGGYEAAIEWQDHAMITISPDVPADVLDECVREEARGVATYIKQGA